MDPVWLLGIGLLPLVALLTGVTGWFLLAYRSFVTYHRETGEQRPNLGALALADFYLRTLAGAIRLAWWNMWGLGRDGLRWPTAPVRGIPVLCIHGFHMTGSSTWGLRRYLERHGRPTRAVSLGLPYRSPTVYSRALVRAIRQLRDEAGTSMDVVAHSMGGLVLRQALAEAPELASSIRRIVTLGTPHRGTALLRGRRSGPVARMMGPDAPYVKGLPEFHAVAPSVEVLTLSARHDWIVFPRDTAHLSGTHRVTVEDLGHLGLLTDRRCFRQVAEALGAPSWSDEVASRTADDRASERQGGPPGRPGERTCLSGPP
jgi:pimeloyl-ACP methyl ester carboxylesterase